MFLVGGLVGWNWDARPALALGRLVCARCPPTRCYWHCGAACICWGRWGSSVAAFVGCGPVDHKAPSFTSIPNTPAAGRLVSPLMPRTRNAKHTKQEKQEEMDITSTGPSGPRAVATQAPASGSSSGTQRSLSSLQVRPSVSVSLAVCVHGMSLPRLCARATVRLQKHQSTLHFPI
jgi:hypothetical protein